MRLIKQNDTSKSIVFLMVDSGDHITPKTGLSPTVTISKNGGSFASPSGTVSEIGNGWYKLTPASSDVNTLGPLVLHATATGADPVDVEYRVVAFDPDSATNLGLSNLDATVSSRSTLTAAQVWSNSTRTLTAFAFEVTVGVNNDKTGYSLSTAGVNAISDAVWGFTSRTLTGFSFQVTVGAYGADQSPAEQMVGLGYTSGRAAALDNLDTTVGSRLATTAYTAPDNAGIAAIKSQTDKLRFTGTSGEELVLASASVDVDEGAIAQAVAQELQGANLVNVVVQPLVARTAIAAGDGGNIVLDRHERFVQSWLVVNTDLRGHDLRLIVFNDSAQKLAEYQDHEISVTYQNPHTVVAVNGPDTKTPPPGRYRWKLASQTADRVLLRGRLVVEDAPDAA